MKRKILTGLFFYCSFSIAQSNPVNMESEPNNTIATANYLPIDDVTLGTLCPSNDVDFYKIVATQDGEIDIYTSSSSTYPCPNTLNLMFFDRKGNLIVSKDMNSGTGNGNSGMDYISIPCAAADTFYIELFINVDSCNSYRIEWNELNLIYKNDTVQHFDFDHASFLAYNTPAEGHLNYTSTSTKSDTDDYYVIYPPMDGVLKIVDSAIQCHFNLDSIQISVFNSNRELLLKKNAIAAYCWTPLTDSLLLNCTGPDTFYLRLHLNIQKCGAYKLFYNEKPETFGNDSDALTDSISPLLVLPGDTVQGHLNYPPLVKSDFYKGIKGTGKNGIKIFLASATTEDTYSGLRISLFNRNYQLDTFGFLSVAPEGKILSDSFSFFNPDDTFYLELSGYNRNCSSYQFVYNEFFISGITNNNLSKATIFPNPFSDHFRLNSPGNFPGQLFIYDLTGMLILKLKISSRNQEIPIRNLLLPGVYLGLVKYSDETSNFIQLIKSN